jgi:hypothetical protein
MAGYDFYIWGKMLFKCSQLWGFARCLAADNRTDLGSLSTSQTLLEERQRNFGLMRHTWAIIRHYFVNNSGLYTVYNEVAYS